MDERFRDVVEACPEAPRPGQDGTWITPEMMDAYEELHRRGLAHSVEAWSGDELVGGVYSVSLGAAFFGESMFARANDASKIAFASLVGQLKRWGIRLISTGSYQTVIRRHDQAIVAVGRRRTPAHDSSATVAFPVNGHRFPM